jgi:replicative DNA helicase
MNDAESFLNEYREQNEKCVFRSSTTNDYSNELDQINNGQYIQPIRTGIDKLDHCFKFFAGMLFLITGFPQSGKSEIIRFFAVKWAMNGNGKICIFSPESDTPILIHEVIKAVQGNWSFDVAKKFVSERFIFLEITENVGMPEIKSMIDEMESKRKEGFNFFIIDPMNWLTSSQYNANTFEALRLTLTYLKQFAKRTRAVVGYVEHPKTPTPNRDGDYPKANIFMVNGGTMHNNKIDACLIMHRERNENEFGIKTMTDQDMVILEVAKLKFQKYLGTPDSVQLHYDWRSGNYS